MMTQQTQSKERQFLLE